MLFNLLQRELLGATLVFALMLDFLRNSEGQKALALTHDTPACWTVFPFPILPLTEAGDTNQVTLGAARYWSFPWC